MTETMTEDTTISTGELFDTAVTQVSEASEPSTTEKVETTEATVDTKEATDSTEKADTDETVTDTTEVAEGSEEKPSFTWDDPANPFKKQYTDTQKSYFKLSDSLAETQRQLQALQTEYGLEDGESVANDGFDQGAFSERFKASEASVRELQGDDIVDSKIWKEDSLWQTSLKHDPNVQHRIKNADSPVSEALKVIKETEFAHKYGLDSEKVIANIKAEYEKELRKTITKEFEEKLKQKGLLTDNLSDVKDEGKSKGDVVLKESTSDLFG